MALTLSLFSRVSASKCQLKLLVNAPIAREGLEVAIKIKGSQGRKRVEWVKPEHPYTAISAKSEVRQSCRGT